MEWTDRQFERTLAYHCAPAMAGIKSADLISWQGDGARLPQLVQQYDRALSGRGIRLRRLWGCLVLVYRPRRLEEQLACPKVRALLKRADYPVEGTLEQQLDHLSRRLSGGEFPHEVGLFLGYPAEDVVGFCRHGGKNFKLCGCWKVYSDVERAAQCFHRYHCCRAALCRRLEEGMSLKQLFRAA